MRCGGRDLRGLVVEAVWRGEGMVVVDFVVS